MPGETNTHIPASLRADGADQHAALAALAANARAAQDVLLAVPPPSEEPPAQPTAQPPATPPADPTAPPGLGIPEAFKVPDKFVGKSTEDIVKAYLELEKLKVKQGVLPAAQPPVQPAAQPNVEPTAPAVVPPTGEPAGSPVQGLELDPNAAPAKPEVPLEQVFAKATKESVEAGSLSDETKALLKAHGVSEAVLNYHLSVAKRTTELETVASAAQEMARKQAEAEIMGSVGGPEAYGKLATWAQANLTGAEQSAYNEALKGSREQVSLVVAGLKARMDQAVGTTPSRQIHGQPPASDVFNTVGEFYAVVGDPRFSKDPAFKAAMVAKYQRSQAAGKIAQ